MTTTMPQIDNTIAAIRAAGLKTKGHGWWCRSFSRLRRPSGRNIYAKDGIAAVNHANDYFETLENNF